MNRNQIETKLNELVGAIKKYSFVDNVTYEFVTDHDVDLYITYKPNKDRYNLDEFISLIMDYEDYICEHYDEDFEIEWID